MSAPTTFAVTELLRLLGVKGQHVPALAIGEYQPVMVMGDFSGTLAVEPIETRAFAGASFGPGGAGRYAEVEFLAVAPGGVVIEALFLGQPESSATDPRVWVRSGLTTFLTGPLTPSTPVPTGGGNPTSQLTQSYSFVSWGSVTAPELPWSPALQQFDFSPIRWFVPSGSRIAFQASGLNTRLNVVISWRELPEPVGAP